MKPRLRIFAVLALTACGTQDPTPAPASRVSARAGAQAVTLITGDRVVMRDGQPHITPGPGRGGLRFTTTRDGDRLYVIPEDARSLLARGQFDLALFEITGLLAHYSDAERADLPLIVTGVAAGFAPGVAIDRALPALHMATAHASRQLTAFRGLGNAKLWLDRKLGLALDHSVPQIGGDVAHARGFTGAGITVAVLDSGIDSTHPDLAGKVIAAEDFTGDGGGVLDVLGHGTHVASIIAGTGAASGGQLAGVAPDARLISGRVCASDESCAESALLAAMAWAAAEQHAHIVNLSLGGRDEPGSDPLEDAITTLSADFGTLFVVSAGNDHTTVGSPASAAAALAVGAVDRNEALAAFSNIGPGISGDALKPEITAPGVDIVAARASGVDPIGAPIGDRYQRLSGTSMAAPHVAGAAALLLQQHPDWTGPQLKAQLVATAQPNPALTVFQQGGGRVDLDRATRQLVEVAPATLDLGDIAPPHDADPPLVRTLHYRNGGSAPITLALAAQLNGPASMASIAPASLTLAPGASADATLTVRTGGALADGRYAGLVVASAPDVRLETPIAVNRVPPTFDVTLRTVQDGAPVSASVLIHGAGAFFQFVNVDGEATVTLPGGRYDIDALLPASVLFALGFSPSPGAVLSFDSAAAGPVAVDVGEPGLTTAVQTVFFRDNVTGAQTTVNGPQAFPFGQITPALPADELLGVVWLALADAPFGEPAHNTYYLARTTRGQLPRGWQERIDRRRLATVTAHHVAQPGHTIDKFTFPYLDEGDRGLTALNGAFLPDDFTPPPYDRTEHFYGDGVVWLQDFADFAIDRDGFFSVQRDYQRATRFAPAQRAHVTWGAAVAAPAFPTRPSRVVDRILLVPAAARRGDRMVLTPALASDSDGSDAFDLESSLHATLQRNGVVIADGSDFEVGAYLVPPERATYRFEEQLLRPASPDGLSPRIQAAWTFVSGPVDNVVPHALPLLAMGFAPPVDDSGTTAARAIVLPIHFTRSGGGTPFVLDARLEVSFDDGAHWTRVPTVAFGAQGLAIIVHPREPAFVSLRSSATDRDGNRIEQTIDRAYAVKR